MFERSIAYLPIQTINPGYPSTLLEGMNADAILKYYLNELLVDIIYHFAIHF